jgi:hypothetical protein
MHISTLAPTLRNSSWTANFSGFLECYDFSLSYFQVSKDMPLLAGITVLESGNNSTDSYLLANLQFKYSFRKLLGIVLPISLEVIPAYGLYLHWTVHFKDPLFVEYSSIKESWMNRQTRIILNKIS